MMFSVLPSTACVLELQRSDGSNSPTPKGMTHSAVERVAPGQPLIVSLEIQYAATKPQQTLIRTDIDNNNGEEP